MIILYTHIRSDAQLVYGNDGFSNVCIGLFYNRFFEKENKKIIVKTHPNFYYPKKKKDILIL